MFWDRFSFLCSKIGKAPNRVAADANLFSTGMITKYKNGATPNGEVLIKVADYFNVTVDYLLERDEPIQITTTEQHWMRILLDLPDDLRNQLEDYLDFLLWKHNRESAVSQSSSEPE